MKPARRQTLLFLLCAAVLLGGGFAWGYANAYGKFYSPEAVVDRELVRLDFDSRVLQYLNANQQENCRRELTTELRPQSTFIRGLLEAMLADARHDAAHKLQQAERALAGQPSGAVGTTGGNTISR